VLKVGEIAPDFVLKDQSGSSVSLDQLLAKGELVLYFYPADFTRVCTAEACAFRDAYDDLSEVKVEVVGISSALREQIAIADLLANIAYRSLCCVMRARG